MTDWVRLWHDMPTDPKWRVVARKSGQPLACVISVFTLMLTNASGNAAQRGVLLAWDHEDAGAALDMDAEDVRSIYDAMQGKVLEGDTLSGWERRQPKREDSGVGKRVAKHREAQRNAAKRDVTQDNAPETDAETDAEELSPNGDCASDDALKPEHVRDAWNDLAPRIGKPCIRDLTPERRQILRARIAGYSIDDWRTVLGAVERSRFLREGQFCTFDWITKKANFQKILEGNYDDKAA